MCLYSRLIKNRKYQSNKKNGGNVPPVTDERTLWVAVGCGNCIECRKQKARGWQLRLLEEVKENKNGKFVTLTFSDKSIKELKELPPTKDWASMKGLTGYELDNEIATRAMRLFNERWRKKYGKALRHWTVTELGHNGTENIHLHGIIWTDEKLETVEKIWKYGYMWKGKEEKGRIINYVNGQTVNYIIKYITKQDEKHTTYKSKILTSPGIGNNYTRTYSSKGNRFQGEKTNETYRSDTGHKISIPLYWRNKIYNEEEREKLWINKLNKEERWVRGEKVSIKNGFEEYDKLVKYYRIQNLQLGYGTDDKDETRMERKKYEEARRKIMQETRIQRAWNREVQSNGMINTKTKIHKEKRG